MIKKGKVKGTKLPTYTWLIYQRANLHRPTKEICWIDYFEDFWKMCTLEILVADKGFRTKQLQSFRTE
nr:hypothetical protein [Mycoplasmopsis bovis]